MSNDPDSAHIELLACYLTHSYHKCESDEWWLYIVDQNWNDTVVYKQPSNATEIGRKNCFEVATKGRTYLVKIAIIHVENTKENYDCDVSLNVI